MTDSKMTPPENPYMAARREWNERYANFIAAANNWRLIALGTTAIAIAAVCGLVWVSGQAKVVPYVVETNQFGEVSGVKRADLAARPTNNHIKGALRQWIVGARTVYVDLRAEQAIVDTTYAMTLPDSPAYKMLAEYHREKNPYQRAASETVELEVHAIVPLSEDTWQIEWTETVRSRAGKVSDDGPKKMQGTFTVLISPPTTDAQIMANSLGIYVRQFAWTTRL